MTVQVVGTTWAGYKSAYQYQSDKVVTIEEVGRLAGDFQFIDDFQIIQISECECCHAHTKREIVRPWAGKKSARLYAQSMA